MYTMSATLSTTTIELHRGTINHHTLPQISQDLLFSLMTPYICRPSKIGQAFSNKVKLIFNWLIFNICLYIKFLCCRWKYKWYHMSIWQVVHIHKMFWPLDLLLTLRHYYAVNFFSFFFFFISSFYIFLQIFLFT